MSETKKIFSITNTKKLPHSQIQIDGEVAFAELKPFRDSALKALLKEAEMPGFRKGAVPEKILIGKIGELAVLHEGAEKLLNTIIPDLLAEAKAYPLTSPNIQITKLADGNPLTFTVIIETMPEVKLGDYVNIAKKENSKKSEPITVTDKDVDEVVLQVRKEKAHQELHEKSGNAHDHSHGEIKEADLPPLDDTFAKTLGDFQGVADLKEKVKLNLIQERERKNKEKNRLEIIEKVIEKSEMEVPNTLVENELNKMEAQFKHDIERMGVKFDDYLKHLKKAVTDLRKDWQEDAVKRVKLQLVLHHIALKEKIEAPKEELEKEVKALMEYYKEADPIRTRNYVESLLINQKVFEFLEAQK